mmetsp:Transcript_10443/g.13237  ORF Transcript_10443/g.13237 Transcript_10443/m.13237 type:complete len:91 (+) Transcript_10443:402-674(+)
MPGYHPRQQTAGRRNADILISSVPRKSSSKLFATDGSGCFVKRMRTFVFSVFWYWPSLALVVGGLKTDNAWMGESLSSEVVNQPGAENLC